MAQVWRGIAMPGITAEDVPTSPRSRSRTGSQSTAPSSRLPPTTAFCEALLATLGRRPVEQLLGVRREGLDDLVARRVPVRVCVPFRHGWFRCRMRRLAEFRGA
jgi:hypothetical protein